MQVHLFDLLLCIGNSVDLISPEYTSHHQQVAFLSYHIGKKLGLDNRACGDLITAGLLHDIGALSSKERLMLIEEEPFDVNNHAFRSAKLLEQVAIFSEITQTVRFHHINWADGEGQTFLGQTVPLTSHILHLADRVCVKFNPKNSAVIQVPGVFERIEKDTGRIFEPEVVNALYKLKRNDHIWLELMENKPLDYLPTKKIYAGDFIDIDGLLEITRMISLIIDFRSHFTATHSAGVAQIASRLGKYLGFSDMECKMLLIAGYLHDLGKLCVPNELLEKPSALNQTEFNIIREHTFHTYRLLNNIKGMEIINTWASYHHEKLNGKGYPFQLSKDRIPLGSRIMAVADVFTSITEDRPYRKGMPENQIISVLKSMTDDGSLCKIVVEKLTGSLIDLIELCHHSQETAAALYESIFHMSSHIEHS